MAINLLGRIGAWWHGRVKPSHLRYGELGERAAKKQLRRQGLKFLTANFRTERRELDLVMCDKDCLALC